MTKDFIDMCWNKILESNNILHTPNENKITNELEFDVKVELQDIKDRHKLDIKENSNDIAKIEFILIRNQRICIDDISSYGRNNNITENKLIIRMKNNFIHEFLFEDLNDIVSILNILDSLFTVVKFNDNTKQV